jgi:hypothetical protein
MAWQILAIWTVVMVTIGWFVHSERQLLGNASMAQARLLYGRRRRQPEADEAAPTPEEPAAVPRRSEGPSRAEREFVKALSQTA